MTCIMPARSIIPTRSTWNMTAGSSSTSSSDSGWFLFLADLWFCWSCRRQASLWRAYTLHSHRAEPGRESGGNTEQFHRYLTRLCASRVASQACLPGETGVGPLCARKDHIGGGKHRGNRPSKTDLDSLLAHERETGAS